MLSQGFPSVNSPGAPSNQRIQGMTPADDSRPTSVPLCRPVPARHTAVRTACFYWYLLPRWMAYRKLREGNNARRVTLQFVQVGRSTLFVKYESDRQTLQIDIV